MPELKVPGLGFRASAAVVAQFDAATKAEPTAHVRAIGLTDPNKQIVMGIDTTANEGFIQATQYGTAVLPLRMQPSGGPMVVGTDPTGPELVRVGGNARVRGKLVVNADSGSTEQFNLGRVDATYPSIDYNSAFAGFRFLNAAGSPIAIQTGLVQGSSVRTGAGITASTASNTYVSLFLPSNYGVGLFHVFIWIPSSGGAYNSYALVGFDGGTTTIIRKDVTAYADLQLSGNTVQAKQVSGSASPISYVFQLIA